MPTSPAARPSSPRRFRTQAQRRLRWLRDAAAAGTLTLAMLHGAPEVTAQIASDPAGSEFQVNTFTTDTQSRHAVAMDADGDFVVVWESRSQDNPGVGLGGIYAQRYAADGTPQGTEFRANTFTSTGQSFPAVAMDASGNFVIVWDSFGQDGDGRGVYGQRYAADGTAQGTEFRANTFTTRSQLTPAVAMDADGDFVIAWGSYGQDVPSDIQGGGIFAQRYAADGTAQGTEFQVNTFVTNRQSRPAVAMDADGDFVITWQSYGQDDPSTRARAGVYAQRYAADGTAQGGEFQVNTFTTGYQEDPSVAMDEAGNFVIAWQSGNNTGTTQDSDGDAVVARRYAADGTAQGGEFIVNTFTSDDQNQPSVGMDADGDFVIAWESAYQDDPDGYYDTGIYAQRYAADGTPQGGEFRVSTTTLGVQDFPAVAVDADGDFVVAWSDYEYYGNSQDGDGSGIFAQRYAVPGPADLRVFDYDAQTYVDNGAMDFDRLATWPDAGPLGLDAPVRGSDARLYSPFQPTIGDPFGDQPVVHYNGTDMGHAIPKDDALFGTPQPAKTLALAFRTSNDVTTRQMLVELGGAEAGLNAYVEGGRLYVGGWSQKGIGSDWGPFFFDTTIAERTGYVLVITHRRKAAGQPGRFEAYLDGASIGLQKTVNSFAATNDNGGLAVVTATTRLASGVSSSSLDRAKVNLGRVVQRNEWLDAAAVATLTSDLQTRFGLTPLDEAPVAASAAVPSGIQLDTYPNPTSGAATVRFGLESTSDVRVAVYDALGREVAVLAEGVREAGWHSAVLSGADLSSGVYVVRVEAGADIATRRVTVLR